MPDTSRPYIRSTIPAAQASGISISSIVVVNFSERMKSSTFTSSTVGVYRDTTTLVNSALDYNDGSNVLMISPSGGMDVNSKYSVVVSGIVQDYYGNPMIQDYWWVFSTGQPSGYTTSDLVGYQPTTYTKSNTIQVVSTTPECYTTDHTTSSISPIIIKLNDECELVNRNYLGSETDTTKNRNPLALGIGYLDDPDAVLKSYIEIENNEVLGRKYIDHTSPDYSVVANGDTLVVTGNGWVDNNEYIVTIKEGLPGLTTEALSNDYSFVFSSNYAPLYGGYNSIRTSIGPILQMVMAYIPDDTLNRYIYEASIEADRIYPSAIDPNDVPWYVEEYVLYQSKLNALYAAIMIFCGSGAGVTKQLADFSISIDARGLMPALLPIIEDYRKLRDLYLGMVKAGTDSGPKPVWAVKSQFDARRPITAESWTRLPFKDVRDEYLNTSMEQLDNTPKWVYAKDLSRTHYISYERYLQEGRYVSSDR